MLDSNQGLDDAAIKALGAAGVMKADVHVTQVVVGMQAEQLARSMKKFLP